MSAARDDLLLEAARVISGARVESVFADLIRAATELLDCQIGLIGRYVEDGEVPAIAPLAVYAHGRFVRQSLYAIEGTPCQTVVGQEFRFYPRGVGYLFPEVSESDARIEGYAAYPLFDRAQRPIGIITVMSYDVLSGRERIESLLRLFAQRAVAELERADAADALRRSEAQYRAIFNASMDGLVLMRPDGEIVDANPAIEQLYGFTRDELVGRQVLDMLARNRVDAGREFMRTVLAEGYAQTEDHATRKDGSEFFCEPRAVLMDYGGEPHVLAIVRDITVQRLHARALALSENQLRKTVDAALDCIVAMDAEGHCVEFNPAAERCFGYRRAEVLGCRLLDLIVPERLRAEHYAELARYLETGIGEYVDTRREVIAMRANGDEFPIEAAIGVVEGSRGVIFIGYLRDITEQRAIEAQRELLEGQLRQAQKMEAIGHLTGGIAHDFNNILTSVLGYVELAAERVEGGDDERVVRYLERARRSGERARDLVQQMLTFSRGQQGAPRELDLADVVTEGLQLLEPMLPASVHIETQCETDLPHTVIDPMHVEQVLVNLCINARDAMDGSGTLRVVLTHPRARPRICSACQQAVSGDFVELAVGDTGPGMTPEVLEHVFEPFFSTKAVGRGSGMGLATVHGIVHEYGGHVVVDTAPGAGAVFRVLLPACRSATPADADAGAAGAAPDGAPLVGRVLVVDDNPAVAEFLEELLSGWGLEVRVITDAASALRCFRGDPHAFDVVVLDQTMPRMSGLELAGALLTVRPEVPVILYTGYAEGLTEQRVRAAGIRALVRKPLDIPAFRTELGALLP
ncbi:MAG: PAS domain S-box protein [Gammaproteobacteria bacterium]